MKRGAPLSRNTPLTARTPLRTRSVPLQAPAPLPPSVPLLTTTKSAARTRSRTTSRRPESFPRDVAARIDARDPWCIHCGTPNNLHRHHRRIKGMGGDPREHTDCACVGVRICGACHEWAHSSKGRREAEAEGLIIPRVTLQPWTLAVLVRLEENRGGLLKYPTCDGRWLDYVPEGRVA